MANQEGSTVTRTRRKTQHGGSTLLDLHQALVDYLPILLGLTKDGSHLQFKVQFNWVNKKDEEEETAMSNLWYEVLSVLHLMAMLLMSQANLQLLRGFSDGHNHPKVSEENRRASIDIFLKAAGYLDCAVKHVLPHFSAEQRRSLPVDLAEGVLRALCLQALGQVKPLFLDMVRLSHDQLEGEMVSERQRIEAPSTPSRASDNNMPPPPSYEEANGVFASHMHDTTTDNMGYFLGEVLFSYHGVTDVELNLSTGEYVVVRKVTSSGWAEGERKGKAGWFPYEYIERRERVLASKVTEVF